MNEPGKTCNTRIWLSFSSAYVDDARRLANELTAANIDVRFDEWKGGGGAAALQSIPGGIDDVSFLVPLLTPSDTSRTWIGNEWKRTIYEEARTRDIDVLPVRGDGDLHAIPKFLRKRSFADLYNRNYSLELRRLITTIREYSGDNGIRLPDNGNDANSTRSPLTLSENPIVIEVGKALAVLVDNNEVTNLLVNEMYPMMRDGLFYELGVQFPDICLRTGSDLPPSSAQVVINDVPDSQWEVHPGSVMVNNSVAVMMEHGFTADLAIHPATGAKCAWISAHDAESAEKQGMTTWDTKGFLILLLSSVLRRRAADFIGASEAQAMLKLIEPTFPLLVAESVPKTVSLFILTDVLRRLVVEGVSIRDLRRILMALADYGRIEYDPLMLTEYVRAALQRQITFKLSRGQNALVIFQLDPGIETMIHEATRHTATGTYVDLEPDRLKSILDAIEETMSALPDDAQVPQILTTMEIRSSVRRLVALSMPRLNVVSYQELAPDINIQPLGSISLDGFRPRPGVSVGGVPLWD